MADETLELHERDIQGLKYFDKMAPLLHRLHDVGCAWDRAGNRKLHDEVQQKLGCPRTSLGSLSEATDVFDPQRLEGILGHLLAQVPSRGSIIRGKEHYSDSMKERSSWCYTRCSSCFYSIPPPFPWMVSRLTT